MNLIALKKALDEAAQSLAAIATHAGQLDTMQNIQDVRAYAESRAHVAREAIKQLDALGDLDIRMTHDRVRTQAMNKALQSLPQEPPRQMTPDQVENVLNNWHTCDEGDCKACERATLDETFKDRSGRVQELPNVGGSSYEASLLRELLARIHGDGGHYVAEHGLDRAFHDADLKIAQLQAAQPVAQEAIQWPTMPPSKGQSPVLFEDGYAEGWAKCLDACKAALAAPQPSQRAECKFCDPHGHCNGGCHGVMPDGATPHHPANAEAGKGMERPLE